MSKTAVALVVIGLLAGIGLGAAGVLWYSEHVKEFSPNLAWNAGQRDGDIEKVLICAYSDEYGSIEDPIWSRVLIRSDELDAIFFPEPVWQDSWVRLPVREVFDSFPAGIEVIFSLSYIDADGFMSEWASTSYAYIPPGAAIGLRLEP
jgi:hypothetical protein